MKFKPDCILNTANLTMDEALEIYETFVQFAKKNIAIGTFMFKDRYFTMITRDVSYTWQSLVCKFKFEKDLLKLFF